MQTCSHLPRLYRIALSQIFYLLLFFPSQVFGFLLIQLLIDLKAKENNLRKIVGRWNSVSLLFVFCLFVCLYRIRLKWDTSQMSLKCKQNWRAWSMWKKPNRLAALKSIGFNFILNGFSCFKARFEFDLKKKSENFLSIY